MLSLALAAVPVDAPAADKAKSEQAAKGTLSKDDARYFERLAHANIAEIEAGKVAQGKAVSEEVKKYAAQMVQDHGKMLDEQKSMAASKGVTLPTAPDKSHQNDLKRLQDQSGPGFDRAFMTQMVKDHGDALKLVQDIADKARDPDLKAAGQKAVPEIRSHLEMAKRIASNTQLPEKASGPKK
jgi:putative membrane protein